MFRYMVTPFIVLLIAVTATNAQATEGSYIGCFNDNSYGKAGPVSRDIPVLISEGLDNSMIPSRCASRCANAGYFYAGLQAGRQCWCGNSYGSYCQTPESHCNSCMANSTFNCGNSNVNAVYVAKPGGSGQNKTCTCGASTQDLCIKPFSVSASISSFGCATASNTLSYSVSASNGVGPYKYSIDGSAFSANTQYNRVRQGNATIIAQDARGVNTTTVFFVGPATSVSLSFVPDVSYGFTTSSTGASDGYVILQAQGGQPPYTYALYPGTTALNAYRTTGTASAAATIRNLEAGDYYAYATDANNCQSSRTQVTINTPVLPAPPRNIVVGVTSVDTVVTATATWDAPTNSGYAAITGYSVQWGYWNGTDIVYNPVETVASATASTIIPILQSTRRFVRLATINSIGVGDYRAPYEFQGLCDAGRYSSRTNCSYCPAGTSTKGTIGRDQCRGCLSGTYSKEGAATCSPCVNNTYSSFGASSCLQCSAGFIAAESYCQPCNPGTYNPTATTTTCLTCPANTYSSRSGSTSCTPCQATYTSTPGSSYCVDSTGYKK